MKIHTAFGAVLFLTGALLGGCGRISCDASGTTSAATPFATPTVVCDNGASCTVTTDAKTKIFQIACDSVAVKGTTCAVGGEYCFGPKDKLNIDSFTWTQAKPTTVVGTQQNDTHGTGCCVDLKVGFPG